MSETDGTGGSHCVPVAGVTIELLVPVEEARVLQVVALQVLIETQKVLKETLQVSLEVPAMEVVDLKVLLETTRTHVDSSLRGGGSIGIGRDSTRYW